MSLADVEDCRSTAMGVRQGLSPIYPVLTRSKFFASCRILFAEAGIRGGDPQITTARVELYNEVLTGASEGNVDLIHVLGIIE